MRGDIDRGTCGNAEPITHRGRDNKQYVAVVATEWLMLELLHADIQTRVITTPLLANVCNSVNYSVTGLRE